MFAFVLGVSVFLALCAVPALVVLFLFWADIGLLKDGDDRFFAIALMTTSLYFPLSFLAVAVDTFFPTMIMTDITKISFELWFVLVPAVMMMVAVLFFFASIVLLIAGRERRRAALVGVGSLIAIVVFWFTFPHNIGHIRLDAGPFTSVTMFLLGTSHMIVLLSMGVFATTKIARRRNRCDLDVENANV